MVNKTVLHKTFGKGIVVEMNEDRSAIIVAFHDSSRKFIYPDAFESFLTAEDSDLQSVALAALQEKRATLVAQRAEKKPILASASRTVTTYNPPKHKNIIFKCNYSDGGASKTSLGFNGICSAKNIRNNIEKRVHMVQ